MINTRTINNSFIELKAESIEETCYNKDNLIEKTILIFNKEKE